MKKILFAFSFLFIFLFLFASFLVAIPHLHEEDYTHANHQSCPIYQAGLQDWSVSVLYGGIHSTLTFFGLLTPWLPERFDFQPLSLPTIRGPPPSLF